jgi:hypothetical protein
VGGDIFKVEPVDDSRFEVIKPLNTVDVDKGQLKFYLIKTAK